MLSLAHTDRRHTLTDDYSEIGDPTFCIREVIDFCCLYFLHSLLFLVVPVPLFHCLVSTDNNVLSPLQCTDRLVEYKVVAHGLLSTILGVFYVC